ncbi:MAG TPA: glycosyltransferase [Gemmatimonadales bacterium]|nr:glycosyltransferase [Gemmatimonadales bacterium]
MTPRVLFLTHTGALGGAELSLLDIARARPDSSTVMLLADGPFRERLASAGLHAKLLPAGAGLLAVRREASLASLGAAGPALRMVRELAQAAKPYDLLYANSEKAFVMAALAGAIARRPVIWHLRDVLCAEHFSAFNIRVVVLLANALAARVIANSHATADAFVRAGGKAQKVCVVYNGFEPGPFDAVADSAICGVREALGVGAAPLVGVFGRLHPWKGQHVAVDALSRLPGVHAIIVGDALFGEEAYVHALQEQVRARALENRVHLLGFRTDIPTLMRAVDMVLHTSVAPEPFGRILVEGMLARRPVVAARAGGTPEVVVDGETGLLVTPGDDAAIAEAIAALLAEPGRRTQMGHAGRERARQLFHVDTMRAGVQQQIEEVTRQ